MSRPHISIAFDQATALITFWNGLHPNHPQHISKIVGLPLTEFNKLLCDRNYFFKMFAVTPTPHIANELKSCLAGFKKVEIDPLALAELSALTKTDEELKADLEVVEPLMEGIEEEIKAKAAIREDGSVPESFENTKTNDNPQTKTDEELKAEAKALGIKGAHLMKPETLTKKINEARGA
jgi:hypothetical protein